MHHNKCTMQPRTHPRVWSSAWPPLGASHAGGPLWSFWAGVKPRALRWFLGWEIDDSHTARPVGGS